MADIGTLKQEKDTASEGSLSKYNGLDVKLTEEARNFLQLVKAKPHIYGKMPVTAIRESLGADAFDSLTLDRIHRKLYKGYTEWPTQWEKLMSSTQTVNDFRTYYGVITGGMDRLPQVDEKMPYLEGDFSDDTISWSPKKYGKLFGYSFEAQTYDDMRLLDQAASKMGQAAARTYEFFFFRTLLDANPTSYDGSTACFGTVGTTDSTVFFNTMTAGGLTTATIETAVEKMLAQTALDSSVTYTDENYVPVMYIPKYVLVHTSQLMNIKAILGSSLVAEDANNRINPIENGDPIQNLQIIHTPYIDSTHWYLIADPAMGANTMEAGLWNGSAGPEFFYEKPDTGHHFGFDENRMKIRQIFGGSLLDPKSWILGTTTT